MKDIYRRVVELLEANEPIALATLVRSRGSTPQRAGAQAIFHADGRSDGNLGGGCLEMEARRRALESLRTGIPDYFPLHLDNDFGFDDGLICGGTAEILLEPMPTRQIDCYRAAAQAVRDGLDAGIATLVEKTPDGPMGARAVAVEGGQVVCDVASPALRSALTAGALSASRREITEPVTLQTEAGAVFVEPLLRSPTLLIVGAGHIGAALCRLAAHLDFRIVVLDDRPAFADEARLPAAHRVVLGDIPRTVAELPLAPDSSVVIVTRGHRHDGAALRELIQRPLAYVGMIGSRRKVKLIFDELVEEGIVGPEELARIRSPLGLDIGAETPDEIAVSIAAELVLARRGSGRALTGRPLSERMRSIL